MDSSKKRIEIGEYDCTSNSLDWKMSRHNSEQLKISFFMEAFWHTGYLSIIHIWLTFLFVGELNEEKNTYEVKIKKEHAASMDPDNKANLEPITSETGKNVGKKTDVIVEKSGGGCQSR